MKNPLLPLLAVPLILCAPSLRASSAADLIARGDTFDAQMRTADALAAYLEAEQLNPDDPDLLIKIATQYGESMVDLQDEASQKAAGERALACAERALALAPDKADAHLAVAICHGRLLDYLPAREKVEASRLVKVHAEKATALDPASDYAWHMLGRWHRAVATTGALLKGIVNLVYGGLPDASNADAAAAFEKAIQLAPNRVAHHIELGITYAEMGRPDDARQSLERGLALPDRERDDPDTKARGREWLEKVGR